MNTKKEYTKPELTIVTFKAEKGYASSGLIETLTFWQDDTDEQQVENYESTSLSWF